MASRGGRSLRRHGRLGGASGERRRLSDTQETMHEFDALNTLLLVGPAASRLPRARCDHLRRRAAAHRTAGNGTVDALVAAASSAETRGYLLELAAYLTSAAAGPRRCVGARASSPACDDADAAAPVPCTVHQ